MDDKTKKFRDGIFSLHNRRFGKVAELMIKMYYGFDKSYSQHHDLYDKKSSRKIEVKASTVRKAHDIVITADNVINVCLNSGFDDRMIKLQDAHGTPFNSPMLQVKPELFDALYYCLFFADYILIFKAEKGNFGICPCCGEQTKKNVNTCCGTNIPPRMEGYSDKQHKGGDMGQFHINEKNLANHIKDYKIDKLTYKDLYNKFKSK